MNYFIITGASHGFGRAIALKLLESRENFVIAISRTNPNFPHSNFSFFPYDLADASGIPLLMKKVLALIKPEITLVYLINNAATVAPIGPIDLCDPAAVIRHFQINVISPTLLSSEVLKFFKIVKGKNGIINISTGASRQPYHGWSCYCSSKASLEMLTKCMALENPEVELTTYDPGVIDTKMQDYIRSQPKENFHSITKFVEFKENHKLVSPDFAADIFVNKFFGDYVFFN